MPDAWDSSIRGWVSTAILPTNSEPPDAAVTSRAALVGTTPFAPVKLTTLGDSAVPARSWARRRTPFWVAVASGNACAETGLPASWMVNRKLRVLTCQVSFGLIADQLGSTRDWLTQGWSKTYPPLSWVYRPRSMAAVIMCSGGYAPSDV